MPFPTYYYYLMTKTKSRPATRIGLQNDEYGRATKATMAADDCIACIAKSTRHPPDIDHRHHHMGIETTEERRCHPTSVLIDEYFENVNRNDNGKRNDHCKCPYARRHIREMQSNAFEELFSSCVLLRNVQPVEVIRCLYAGGCGG